MKTRGVAPTGILSTGAGGRQGMDDEENWHEEEVIGGHPLL